MKIHCGFGRGIGKGVILLAMAGIMAGPVAMAQPAPGDLDSAQVSQPQGSDLSPAAADVLRMAQSGSDESVLVTYAQNSIRSFNLDSDNISYMRDLGVSSSVIDAMLTRDRSFPASSAPASPYVYNQQAYPPSGGTLAPPPGSAPPPVEPPPSASVNLPPPSYATDAPEDVNYFYSDLAPYGSWVDLQGYGWCWQPTAVAVNTTWRPYCDGGHWIYTDSGWFWQSDYTWGWAPFHYGRWYHHERAGWVWFPDRVWGPGWVTWRTAGDQCGWAPLPLHTVFDIDGSVRFNGVRVGLNIDFGLPSSAFTFVALGDIRDRDLRHRRLPQEQVNRFYNRTTIINCTVVNRTIVNRGIPVSRVAEVTHADIRPVPIRDAGFDHSRDRSTPDNRRGPVTEVFRHDLRPPPAHPAPFVAQKIDDRHPVVQHSVPVIARVRDTGARPPNVVTPPDRNRALEPRTAPVVTAPVRPGPTPIPPVHTDVVKPAPAPLKLDTPAHGRTVLPSPRNNQRIAPEPFEAKPEDLTPPPKPEPKAPAPTTPFDYRPRSHQATQAHVLPPEVPAQPKPFVPAQPKDNTVSHDFTPRSQQATDAHVLPALTPPPPSRSIIPSTPSPAPAAPPPANAVSSPRDKERRGH